MINHTGKEYVKKKITSIWRGMSIIKQATGFFQVSTVLSNTALVLVLRKGEHDTSMYAHIKQVGTTGRDVCDGA